MRRFLLISLLLLAAALAFFVWWPSDAGMPANASLESLLVDDGRTSEAYARALIPGAVEFPRDLGVHEDYQTEWWYYTGNLQTEGDGDLPGREFGYQFTIFRRALRPLSEVPEVDDPSAWRSNQLYLAHFTISDIEGDEFYVSERFSRDGAGLAGAQSTPYRVWLEDWSVAEAGPGEVRIQAKSDDVTLDITLKETLPPVLHGDGGLSQKGPEPGNASYYYSIVQQQTSGQLAIGEERFDVQGLSWMDHEYSTTALSPGSVGWDWFSLQLENGAALMLFQIRREDGTIEPYSSGSFITGDGTVQSLSHDAWQLEVLDTWQSPASGAEYPAGWRLRIPAVDLELEGRPLMADQELRVSTIYWEGASEFSGSLAGEPVTAQGYVEMTGYAGMAPPS
ncbi:MAG: lipocalin-like domain-containing protein [Candidatus Promineifilaceae bacterium]|jgi:predicted secreted hydrolase